MYRHGARRCAVAVTTVLTSSVALNELNLERNQGKLMKVLALSPKEDKLTSWTSYLNPFQYLPTWRDADLAHFSTFAQKTEMSHLMSWPSLERGLKARATDEAVIIALTNEAKAAIAANDKERLASMPQRFMEAAYGPGITAEMRNAHVELYGCVKYTDKTLQIIADLAKSRNGVVELGAGHGQWAKQLRTNFHVDVIAFDNMATLPLRDQKRQNPAFSEVIRGNETILETRQDLHGRVLLLVFPDPGAMAHKCLSNYMRSSPKNDVFVYVGEGRGGANGDAGFFDLLESGEWTLEMTLPLEPFGTKGYERFFVFRRVDKV